MAAVAAQPMLQAIGVKVDFGAVPALRDANLELRGGEVMALVGENGAGKSTLVRVLGGILAPDSGSVRMEGKDLRLGSVQRTQAAGISVVQQEPSVIGTMSVAENLFLGAQIGGGRRGPRRLARAARPLLDAVGLEHIDPQMLAEGLEMAERQLIEFARVLARQAKVVVLDEPTAALSDAEIAHVGRTARQLAREGRALVYVTHRLGEVFDVTDRVTVMRNGVSQPPVRTASLSMEELIERIVGRPLAGMFPARGNAFGPVILSVDRLRAPGLRAPVSFSVRAGEILGLAGQVGSGNLACARAIAGVSAAKGGRVQVGDIELPAGHSLRNALSAGVAYCSEDRKQDGIFASQTVTANLTAVALKTISRHGAIRPRAESRTASALAARFAIDPTRLGDRVGNLSGGNQQKVALGKWMALNPRLLVVTEPTRGVDVGARAEIYRHLRALASEGLAVVIASTNLDELHGLADSLATFFGGNLVRHVSTAALSASAMLRDVTHPEQFGAVSSTSP